jgi:hypothetical protein
MVERRLVNIVAVVENDVQLKLTEQVVFEKDNL